jgi:c-di-GMP-binding flagellar brake protein YcgR
MSNEPVWTRLKSLLGKPEQPEAPTEEQTNAAEAETLLRLQQLAQARTFVDVRFPERTNQSYQSLILKVNAEEKYLLIDEFFPGSENALVSPGDEVEITSQRKGMPVRFGTIVQSICLEEEDGMPAYKLKIPDNIEANQRRRHFRVQIDPESGIKVRIPDNEGTTGLLCTVYDLSHAGIGFSAGGNITGILQESPILIGAKLNLPDGTPIECDIEVKSFDFRRHPYRHTTVGGKLSGIPATMQKKLDQYLASMQRLQRKQMADEALSS